MGSELRQESGCGQNDEELDEPEASMKPATFQGRLQLQDFMFGQPAPALRRSLRGQQPAARPTPTSGIKRKRSSRDPSSSLTVAAEQSKKKPNKRQSSSYAPPSTYAHLPLLPDAIAPDLYVLFVGLNPGIQTARTGHAYAHPSNLFWKLLYSSGVTPRPCTAQEDRQMPSLYRLGFTNIVERPSRNGAELSRREMDDGVAALHDKARRWRPQSMCIVGKSIWESIWRVRHGGCPVGRDFRYGWQDDTENLGRCDGWDGARVFVATSTSGLAASLSPAEKERIWKQLGEWVVERRAARAAQDDGPASARAQGTGPKS